MIRFTGVNHLAFATGAMDRTVRFWRDLFGMRLIATTGQPGFRHYFFELSLTDTVAFFEWEGVEAVTEKPHGMPVRGPFIFDHVSFGMDSADDLWTLKDKLAALADITGLDMGGAFRSVREHIGTNTALVLNHSCERQCTPFDAALEIIHERWRYPAPSGWRLGVELIPASSNSK